MIDLYGMSSPNVTKITIMLEETGLPYEMHHVKIAQGQQFSPEFLAMNPNAKVPVIVDRDAPGGKPHVVFESGAICWYLGEKSGKLIPQDPIGRSLAMQWTMFQMSTQGPMLGQYTHFTRNPPPDLGPDDAGIAYSRRRYLTEAKRIYELLDKRLAEVPYVAGQDVTVADILLIPWVNYVREIQGTFEYGWEPAKLPHLVEWSDRMQARPGVQAGLAAIAKLREQDMATFGQADPDALDRFFRRGRWAVKV